MKLQGNSNTVATGGHSGKNAVLVGAGIFASRVLGIVRERVFAYYFGGSDAADAFKAALKIPNLLQNLFGEGALSASFIPVYAGLLGAKNKEEADETARAVGSILIVVMALLVLAGILATPLLVNIIAPGFAGEKRDATIRMVRILFPGIGILVLSAWCLGVLNSHRKFFLPYAAPVLWNLAIIGAIAGFGGSMQSYPLAEIAAWGAVAGSLLQFGVQLPSVLRLIGRFQFKFSRIFHRDSAASKHIRAVIKNFIPGVATRGVNQLSGYIDTVLASFLTTGALTTMSYAQTIYLLPVSLFSMSIANAELPEMSSRAENPETVAEPLRERLNDAMRRVAFFIIPSAAVFLALGDSIVNLLYQTGKFTRDDGLYVWMALAGYATGLLAATFGRLYMSAFWAIRDTRTPFRFAAVRVALAAGLGWLLAFPVAAWLELPPRTGLIGLTVSAGIAAWVEFTLLRAALNSRIGKTGINAAVLVKLCCAATCAAAAAFALKQFTRELPPPAAGSIALLFFGIIYFAAAALLKIPEATRILNRFVKRTQ